jgi:hypothetical protein
LLLLVDGRYNSSISRKRGWSLKREAPVRV